MASHKVNKSNVVERGLYSYRQRVRVIRVVNVLWHNILTTVMTRIVVDKSTDYAKTYSICFLLSSSKENVFLEARSAKKRHSVTY